MIEKVVSRAGVYAGSSDPSRALRPLVDAIAATRNVSPPSPRNVTVVLLPPALGDSLQITSMRLAEQVDDSQRATLEMPPQVNQLAASILELMENGVHRELTARLTETLMSRL